MAEQNEWDGEFASVGSRAHLINGEHFDMSVQMNLPVVALCGVVYRPDNVTDGPRCRECNDVMEAVESELEALNGRNQV